MNSLEIKLKNQMLDLLTVLDIDLAFLSAWDCAIEIHAQLYLSTGIRPYF